MSGLYLDLPDTGARINLDYEDPQNIKAKSTNSPTKKVDIAIESIARTLLDYFQSKLRDRLHYWSCIDLARSEAVKEIDVYQVPKLEEMKRYVETLKELKQLK